MSKLYEQIARTLPPEMAVPDPLRQLFEWIENHDYYTERATGERIGFLPPEDTKIALFAEGNVNMKYWFGHEREEMLSRLCVFAKTGKEGSMAAFWHDPAGGQKIVHLGSGSGSTLVCVLADDPVDFLRLLAIGYDEICWDMEYGNAPKRGQSRIFAYHHLLSRISFTELAA